MANPERNRKGGDETPMLRTFEANHQSKCPICSTLITAGDDIVCLDDDHFDEEWVHAECAEDEEYDVEYV
jgi:hypothetical protein